jgi:serine/threonine protein kinase
MPILVANRFAVQERIGEGTFGEVWRAIDQASSAHHIVALKIFRPLPTGIGADGWDPVYREVAAGLRMSAHPNVVRSWALVETDFFGGQRTPCLVMDYVEGANLALWLAGQPLPGADTIGPRLAVMSGLLQGIAHAHANGVAHQDISFGNVLVRHCDPPDALLTDFGCAQSADAEPRPGEQDEDAEMLQPINPPPYSLHQPLGESARRDVYAFGTLCYLALVGRHPLSDEWQTMRTGQWKGPSSPHRTLERRTLADLAPWVRTSPEMVAISDLLLSCVAAEPAQRPASGVVARSEWAELMRSCRLRR